MRDAPTVTGRYPVTVWSFRATGNDHTACGYPLTATHETTPTRTNRTSRNQRDQPDQPTDSQPSVQDAPTVTGRYPVTIWSFRTAGNNHTACGYPPPRPTRPRRPADLYQETDPDEQTDRTAKQPSSRAAG